MTINLNFEQLAAIDSMQAFLIRRDEPFFVLKGSSGTGKTTCIKDLVPRIKGRIVFTAPTNKATKVLKETLRSPTYFPECKTIYSLLGLRLEANGEVKELSTPDELVDLTKYACVIVDEGSMVNAQLMHHIKLVAAEFGVPFIFMGDAAQLPPVGERASPIWTIETGAVLERVMRHDNQILELATRLRLVVDHPAPQIRLESNNDGFEGVWKLGEFDFRKRILKAVEAGRFSSSNCAKVIAWRNATVGTLNRGIRDKLFGPEAQAWLPTDRIIITEPAKNLEDEIIATIDDEGTVTRVSVDWHPIYQEFKVWTINATLDGNELVTLRVLHKDSLLDHTRRTEELAASARANHKLWGLFWEFKEAFHKVRHGYAITAHRSQGSTYDAAFVDWRDILLNRNRSEAFRCLYVACTRPRKELYL